MYWPMDGVSLFDDLDRRKNSGFTKTPSQSLWAEKETLNLNGIGLGDDSL